MVSSWFSRGGAGTTTNDDTASSSYSGNNNKQSSVNVKNVISCLYPPKGTASAAAASSILGSGSSSISTSNNGGGKGSRFTPLLLEHGEKHLQDWAVMGYSTIISDGEDNDGDNEDNSKTIKKQSSLQSQNSSHSNEIQWSSVSPVKFTNPDNAIYSPLNSLHKKKLRNNSYISNNSNSSSLVDKESFPSSVNMSRIEGRLHVCSRSIVFEPQHDTRRGIIRCPFTRMSAQPVPIPNDGSFESISVEFVSKRHVVVKENNVLAPYQVVVVPLRFQFTFLHSSPTSFMELVSRLFQMYGDNSNIGAGGHKQQRRLSQITPELDALLRPMLDRPFMFDNLVDLVREQVLATNVKCWCISPLQETPGVLAVTSERVYFQPAVGVGTNTNSTSATTRATSWSHRDLVATARRYRGLRDAGLELYYKTSSNTTKSVLFGFERRHDRETVLSVLSATTTSTTTGAASVVCFTDRDFVVQAYKEWKKGSLSNYEYLLALNSAAGRSFHDLSRYPVFPWIVADYESKKLDLVSTDETSIKKTFRDLSKPVGALNPERLEYFRARMMSMQEHDHHNHNNDGSTATAQNHEHDNTPNLHDQAFLYGTHYSAPGYVLYYLVRSMPEHMLCLQNGKFDSPDRMFHSIRSCHTCTRTNHADVKELLPEFYDLSSFDFLINARGLPLGATQQGDRVDDVQLPPWAKSPRDFIRKNSKALNDSQYVNAHLQEWIDLIFGCKSRGTAAQEACNLFHPAAYLGPANFGALKTERERFHAELQATEFGIVPDQLFDAPHPAKVDNTIRNDIDSIVDASFISKDIGRASSNKDDSANSNNRETWELLSPPQQQQPDGDQATSSALGITSDGEPSRSTTPTGNKGPPWTEAAAGNNAIHHHHEDSPSSSSAAGLRNLPLRGTGESTTPNKQDMRSLSSFSAENDNINMNVNAFSASAHTPTRTPHPPQNIKVPASSSPKIQSFSDSPQQTAEWDMKVLERAQIHGDAVSGCVLLLQHQQYDDLPNNRTSLLATTSLDGGLKVHKVSLAGKKASAADESERKGFPSTLSRFSYSTILSRGPAMMGNSSNANTTNTTASSASSLSKLTEYRSHSSRDPLASLVLASDGAEGHVAFAGGHDDVVLAYGINSACAVASVYSHRDAVTGLDVIPRDPLFDSEESALWLENSTHILVSGSWDATVKVWSASVSGGEAVAIHREPLAELFDADSSIVCVSAKGVPSMGGIVIGAGCADGSFCVWNVHSDGVQVVIHNEPARRGSGPCSVVKWVSSCGGAQLHLFAAFSTGMVASYALVDGALHRISAVSVGVAVLSLVYAEGFLLIGSADGALRLIPVRDGAYFEKPTLWNAVNNKSSPGISSISVTNSISSTGKEGERSERFICCTGGEDGSLALFELRKAHLY